MRDIQDYHMSPVQAAEVAKDAKVKKLVLNHIAPPVINFFAKRSSWKPSTKFLLEKSCQVGTG